MSNATVYDKIQFLKDYRNHPGSYFPLVDHHLKVFERRDEEEYNI